MPLHFDGYLDEICLGLVFYSYRNASIGSSFDAFNAG